MRLQLTLVLLLAVIQSLVAQSTFQVIDKDSGEPLVGATAALAAATDTEAELLISDAQGKFTVDRSFPFDAEIRFIGYNPQKIKITGLNQKVNLVRSESRLDDVVITGQYQAQSAKKSVYKVNSIGSDRIKAQGANSLLDVLSNELNFQVSRDNATGRSGIRLQGLGGQYVKILLDGIPVSGRGGTGNDIDLGQIDAQIIDRIEIIEGPMAVNYGADALAGVVNIITKKDISSTLDMDVLIQEESIGSEYSLFDQGIHSPSFKLGYKINEKWYTQINGRYQKYGGWTGNSTGRAKDWYPKTQYFGGFMTRYEIGKLDIYYRLDFLDETLENLGNINDNNPLVDPFAVDEEYLSNRWMHQIQGDLKLGNATLNSVFSYTDFERNTRQFTKNLVTESETLTVDSEQDTVFYRSFFGRQTLNNFLAGEWGSLQLGVETTFDVVGGTTLSDGDKTLTDIALFTSAEFILGNLKVRPGVRFTHNSIFTTVPTPSINFNFSAGPNTQLRWSYGRGFRAPSLRELYHEFIDANHNLIGNPELQPEYSHNVNVDITRTFENIPLEISLGGYYNNIDNRITFISPEGTSNQLTSYINQLKFKTTGVNLRASYEKSQWTLKTGGTYNGRYQFLSETDDVPEFVFAPEVNTQISYRFSKLGLQLAAFYKYTGAFKDYRLDGNDTPQLRRIDAFHLLDATLSKSLKSFRFSFGARNITNVTAVNSTFNGGVHSGGSQSPVGNGRSYFLRLNYHFEQ